MERKRETLHNSREKQAFMRGKKSSDRKFSKTTRQALSLGGGGAEKGGELYVARYF